MKFRTLVEKGYRMDLQVFADDPDGTDNDDDSGEEDTDDEADDDDGGDEQNEKKYTQKDIDEAVQKRLAREKRKWQREQQKKAGEHDSKGKLEEMAKKTKRTRRQKALRDKAAKADDLELKWTCLEHDVDKSCVDDVLALAKVHMAKDEDMDIEDAIDEVLKKYPQFKAGPSKDEDDDNDDETEKKKSWGQRQRGGSKKTSGVEAAFLKRNPGLKID